MPILAISLLSSQDVAGTYQLTGLYIIHQSIARYDTPIQVTDDYAMGITIPIDQIEAGEIYKTTYQGPYGHKSANALNVILNVTFYTDGTAVITEGSTYPTELLDEALCDADIKILPITDDLIYFSDLEAVGHFIPSANIIGSVPDGLHDHLTEGFVEGSTSIFAGDPAGSIGLSQTAFLDHFPSTPEHPTLCDGAGNCFDVIRENGVTVFGGQELPGSAAGYVIENPTSSIATNAGDGDTNDCADIYVEWHAIDGPLSGSGLGDIIGEDEDGDGTDFDRIWAIEELTVTHMKLSCGYGHPIFGDVLAEFPNCAEYLEEGNDGFVWDAAYANWGNFLTYNAAMYAETGDPSWAVDDSDHEYNGVDGRLVMNYANMCIQDINVRHTMLEFNEAGPGGCINWGGCEADPGDLDNSGGIDAVDITKLIACILAQNCASLNGSPTWGCAGDVSGDGSYSIMDIISLVYCVLDVTCGGRIDDASEAKLIIQDQKVLYEADGSLGGIDITLKHGIGFSVQPTNSALYSSHITEGNETRLIIITPETNELFTFSGEFEFVHVIAANSHEEIAHILPEKFGLTDAYPNPFNPTTSMKITLTVSGNMQIGVYNLEGKLVESLASGYHNADTYLINWNATNVPSGIYFIQAESDGMISTQKVMLVK